MHAEDFKKDLKIFREEHQRRASEGLCLCSGEKGHCTRDCKAQPFKAKAKDWQSKFKVNSADFKIKILLNGIISILDPPF